MVRCARSHFPVVQIVGTHLHWTVLHEVSVLGHAFEPALQYAILDTAHSGTNVDKASEDCLITLRIRHSNLIIEEGLEAAGYWSRQLHIETDGLTLYCDGKVFELLWTERTVRADKVHFTALQ